MTLPNGTEIFTRTLSINSNSSSPILVVCPNLMNSIESKRQALQISRPELGSDDISNEIVHDLFVRLRNNPVEPIIYRYWQSLLYCTAFEVAKTIFRIVSRGRSENVYLNEIQFTCISAIGRPIRLIRFNCNLNQHNDLLSGLNSYAFSTIKYSVYPIVRVEYDDPNIGRSDLSLFNRYSPKVISDALDLFGDDPSRRDLYLDLCRCTKEYLSTLNINQNNRTTINQLEQSDFDRISELYQGESSDSSFLPVREILIVVGKAIRKFVSKKKLSTNTPIANNMDNDLTIEDTIPGSDKPNEYIEGEEFFTILDDCILTSIDLRDRTMLYLSYQNIIKLTQVQIALIELIIEGEDITPESLHTRQSSISGRKTNILARIGIAFIELIIKQENTTPESLPALQSSISGGNTNIRERIANALNTINPQGDTQPTEIIGSIGKIIKEELYRLRISRVNTQLRMELEGLIPEYKQLFPRPSLPLSDTSRELVMRICQILNHLWDLSI